MQLLVIKNGLKSFWCSIFYIMILTRYVATKVVEKSYFSRVHTCPFLGLTIGKEVLTVRLSWPHIPNIVKSIWCDPFATGGFINFCVFTRFWLNLLDINPKLFCFDVQNSFRFESDKFSQKWIKTSTNNGISSFGLIEKFLELSCTY